MFSYVDANIRKKLEKDKLLIHLNKDGNPVLDEKKELPFISILGPIPMPRITKGKEQMLSWYTFVRRVELSNVLKSANLFFKDGEKGFVDLLQTNMSVNSILANENFLIKENPLVRIHSCCMTGDVFGSLRCECGPQLESAFEKIYKDDGGGAVVYMSGHEGRGIGLWAKAVTYLLQDNGQDTYQANTSLGLPEDSRDFSDAAVVLRYLLKGKKIRLLSNNPLKHKHLEQYGQPVSEIIPHVEGISRYNVRYLRSKKEKGHNLPDIEE